MSEWIKVSERKPTSDDFPVWMHCSVAREGCSMTWRLERFSASSFSGEFTHWQSAEKFPNPPKDELTQAEKDNAAYHAWHATANGAGTLFAFEAGIAYERAEITKLYDTGITSSELLGKIFARVKGGGS